MARIRRLCALMVIMIVFGFPGLATAGTQLDQLEQLMIESADGPVQHAALARYFRARAELARAEAKEIEKRGRSFLYVQGNAGAQRFHRERSRAQARERLQAADQFENRALAHERAAQAGA